MSKAMYDFKKELFNTLHKSYYNEIDMQIFKECKTINPVGETTKDYHRYSVQRDALNKYFCYDRVVCRDRCQKGVHTCIQSYD